MERRLAQKAIHRIRKVYERARTAFSCAHLHGPRYPKLGDEDVVVVCLVKDGATWLEAFLEHHATLGVAHFVFIDNGSSDATLDILRKRSDVTVMRSLLPVKHYESHLRRWAIGRFARGHWCLCIDVDEFLDYPGSGTLPLRGLVGYLNHEGYTCVVGQMLDMFPEHSVSALGATDARDFLSSFQHYDLSGINAFDYHDRRHVPFEYFLRENIAVSRQIKWLFGGIRRELFEASVCLTKHPLVRVLPGVMPSVHPHCVSRAHCADFSVLLRHYKFAGDFIGRTRRQVNIATWDNGEDEHYLRVIDQSNSVHLMRSTSYRFSGVKTLVDQGFIVSSPKLERWIVKSQGINDGVCCRGSA